MSRILAIDYGESRTGLAITDPLGFTAQGLETINNQGSDKVILRRLAEIVEEYDINKFVIGYPINMD
jgi:putative Holliday junction resolvase